MISQNCQGFFYLLLFFILITDSVLLGLHSTKKCQIITTYEGEDGDEVRADVNCPATLQPQCPGPYQVNNEIPKYICPFELREVLLGAISIGIVCVKGIGWCVSQNYKIGDKRWFLFIRLCISLAAVTLCFVTSGFTISSLKSVDISTILGASQSSFYGCPIMFIITGVVCCFTLVFFMATEGKRLIHSRVTPKPIPQPCD